MRRPRATRKQKQYAKGMRALLRLRRAAVAYSLAGDREDITSEELALCFAELTAACDAYRNTMVEREVRKLTRRLAASWRER